MDGAAQLVQSQLAQGGQAYAPSADLHPNLGYDTARTLPDDFSQVLESFRTQSDKVGQSVQRSIASGAHGSQQLGQLANLYSYAVDTQLLVRAAGQMTSGLRQLVSGQ